MANPIKYSDLVIDDGAITDLINQLKELQTTYKQGMTDVQAQAKNLAGSMKEVSGATEQGREATKKAATEAERLAKAQREQQIAMSETGKEIQRLNKAKREANTISRLEAQLATSTAGSYNHLSAQYSLLKIRLNEMSEAERQNTKAGQQMEQQAYKIYQRMIKLQEVTGKHTLSVGHYEKSMQGLNAATAQIVRELPSAAVSANTFFLAISNNIPMLQDQIQLLIQQNKLLRAQGKETVNVFKAVGKSLLSFNTITVLAVTALTLFGGKITEWIGNLFKSREAIDANKIAMEQYIGAMQKAKESAQDEIVKTKLLYDATQDTNNSMEDRLKVATELKNLYPDYLSNMSAEEIVAGKAAEAYQRLANQILSAARARALQDKIIENAKKIVELEEKQVEAQRRLEEARANAQRMQGAGNLEFGVGLTGGAPGVANIAVGQSIKKASDDLAQITANIEALTEANERLSNKVDVPSLVRTKPTTQKATKEKVKKNEKDTNKAYEDAQKERRKEEEKEIARRAKLRQQEYDAKIKQFNDEKKLALSEIDLLEITEEEKTKLRLQAERDRLIKVLALNEKYGDKLSKTEVKTMENTIEKLDKKISEKAKEKESDTGEPKDIYDLFGFNLSDEQKEGINTSLGLAMDTLNQWTEARIQAADRAMEAADREVQGKRDALQAEIDARNNGYAHNVALARKELDMAKRNQEKAQKEQAKAQKAQLAMQSITQAGNMVTASSLIWSQLGVWALPAIALMWATFAATKVKAAKETKVAYGEGTVELLEGGSHQSGNDIDLGRTSKGTKRRAEGGEYFAVINKRNSRKYRKIIPDVVQSLNNGSFGRKYMKANGEDGVFVNVQTENAHISEMNDNIRTIKEQGERKRYVNADGNVVERYKNLTQTIKKI